MAYKWSLEDIPDLSGKVALVTGGTGGIGLETVIYLGKAGATVFVGGRNEGRGKEAIHKIKQACPQAKLDFALIDHASLKSVEQWAQGYNATGHPLDILINNAGVFNPPPPDKTVDGFEIQWGTNYLSHFALTLHLLPSLRRSPSPRVVNVTSVGARECNGIDFDDLNHEKGPRNHWLPYRQSKLGNLLFTLGLKRRAEESGWKELVALSCHPGFSITGMTDNLKGDFFGWMSRNVLKHFMSQPASDGALPSVFAATSSDVVSGGYYCPKGMFEAKGKRVGDALMPPLAKDEGLAGRLWNVSEELTGVKWDF